MKEERKLIEAGIGIKDGKIAQADVEKAIAILLEKTEASAGVAYDGSPSSLSNIKFDINIPIIIEELLLNVYRDRETDEESDLQHYEIRYDNKAMEDAITDAITEKIAKHIETLTNKSGGVFPLGSHALIRFTKEFSNKKE